MGAIEFRLPSRAIREALDNTTDYVQRIADARRTECLYAIADVLNENGYLPTGTTWDVEGNLLYFYTYKEGSDEDLAHYFHQGLIYGPNIPVFREYAYSDGRRYGIGEPYKFVSPKGQKKHLTGEYIASQGPGSPTGVSHWTEAVEEGGELFDEVVERCEEILRR